MQPADVPGGGPGRVLGLRERRAQRGEAHGGGVLGAGRPSLPLDLREPPAACVRDDGRDGGPHVSDDVDDLQIGGVGACRHERGGGPVLSVVGGNGHQVGGVGGAVDRLPALRHPVPREPPQRGRRILGLERGDDALHGRFLRGRHCDAPGGSQRAGVGAGARPPVREGAGPDPGSGPVEGLSRRPGPGRTRTGTATPRREPRSAGAAPIRAARAVRVGAAALPPRVMRGTA